MKKIILFVGLIVLLGCTEKTTTYTVDFTTDVVIDSCSSITIHATALVEEGAQIDQKGILVSACPSPKLSDPEGAEFECFETPDIYVSDSTTIGYSFSVHALINSGYSMFEPGVTYYTRPFVVIQHVPYYGATVDFSCQ